MIPACRDPHYFPSEGNQPPKNVNSCNAEPAELKSEFSCLDNEEEEAVFDGSIPLEALQDVRSLPCVSGDLLFWTGRITHFGGRLWAVHDNENSVPGMLNNRYRNSFSFAFSAPTFEPPELRLQQDALLLQRCHSLLLILCLSPPHPRPRPASPRPSLSVCRISSPS